MASKPPRVSVGVPVYNGEAFLAESLDSLLDQTFADFELIILDNASTDRTEDIGRKYAADDSRVRYLRNGRNIGMTKNFNQLFYLARGEYFRWAAHDDLVAPEYLEHCVATLDEDPSAVLASPRVRLIDDDGESLRYDPDRNVFVSPHGETVPPTPALREAGSSPIPRRRFADVALNLRGGQGIAYVYGLIRSEALEQTTLLEPYIGSDKVIIAQLSLLGKIREVPHELFFWRIHPRHSGGKRPSAVRKDLDPTQKVLPGHLWGSQFIAYARSVLLSPLPPWEKLLCMGTLVRKVAQAIALRVKHVRSGSS